MKKNLQEEMRNFLEKTRVMVKVGISPSISKETIRRVLWKTDLKWTHFQRKEILTKNDLKLRLKFARKVCRKPVLLERVGADLLKSSYYYKKQNL